MVILDDLPLLLTVVLADDALAGKGHPQHESVPGFSGIGRGADGPPHILTMHEVEQKERSHHAAQGAKRHVQPVPAAVRPQFAQNGRQANFCPD